MSRQPINSDSTGEERLSVLLSSHLAHYNRDMWGEEREVAPGTIAWGFLLLLVLILAVFVHFVL